MNEDLDLSGNTWTSDRLAFLGAHYGRGLSADAIAKRLRTTRSAVCGMAHRLGLTGLPKPIPVAADTRPKPTTLPAVKRTAAPVARRAPALKAAVRAQLPPRIDPGMPDPALEIPLLGRPRDACAALTGARNAEGEVLACGAPVAIPGTSWCAHHRVRYTVGAPVSRSPEAAKPGPKQSTRRVGWDDSHAGA